jgi:hypothetical protein
LRKFHRAWECPRWDWSCAADIPARRQAACALPSNSTFFKGRWPGLPSAIFWDKGFGLRPLPFLAPPCPLAMPPPPSRLIFSQSMICAQLRLLACPAIFFRLVPRLAPPAPPFPERQPMHKA